MPAQNHQQNPRFCGLWIPLITPFRDGLVDHESLSGLVQRYSEAGVSGFVACGSTGEAAALDDDEQFAVMQARPARCSPMASWRCLRARTCRFSPPSPKAAQALLQPGHSNLFTTYLIANYADYTGARGLFL